jgi:hypothetical protein
MTLRSLLDARRAEGRRMSLEEAIAVIVPVCLDLKERHGRGEKLYVHPSAIAPSPDGLARVNTRLSLVPTTTHDKHCLAPELQRTLEPGDACSSVYSVGAILYEMVTGQHVGPSRSSSARPSSASARTARPTSAPWRAPCTTWLRRRASTRPTSARRAST